MGCLKLTYEPTLKVVSRTSKNLALARGKSGVDVYKYKYNGKEWQDELGLNLYDYGARNYDPALGRFFNLDNYSELYFEINPYQYTSNNPVKFIDVNGDYIYIYENGNKYKYENGKTYSSDKDGIWNEYQAAQGSYISQIADALNSITGGDKDSAGSHFLNSHLSN